MKHDIVSGVDLYVNGRYFGPMKRAVICTKDEIPQDISLYNLKEDTEVILAVYPEKETAEVTGDPLADFFKKVQDKRFKKFLDNKDAKR